VAARIFLLLVWAFTAAAFAQSYPDKPIRPLLTFAAGGQADLLARSVTERMRATRFVAAEAVKWSRAVKASGAVAD
jgi:tripartite-type tricarboxylate transporter receptor subunit TctC